MASESVLLSSPSSQVSDLKRAVSPSLPAATTYRSLCSQPTVPNAKVRSSAVTSYNGKLHEAHKQMLCTLFSNSQAPSHLFKSLSAVITDSCCPSAPTSICTNAPIRATIEARDCFCCCCLVGWLCLAPSNER